MKAPKEIRHCTLTFFGVGSIVATRLVPREKFVSLNSRTNFDHLLNIGME